MYSYFNYSTFTHAVPSPPSNLSVSQTSLTSVVVSWTPSPHGADGYTIYYKLATVNGILFSRHVQDYYHSITLYLQTGEKYLISIVATNDVMNSTEIGPLNITLCKLCNCTHFGLVLICCMHCIHVCMHIY